MDNKKLVSKNSVLKFKLGNKILKFLNPSGNLPVLRTNTLPAVANKNLPSVIRSNFQRVGRFAPWLRKLKIAGPLSIILNAIDLENKRLEFADKLNSGKYYIENGKLVENEAVSGASIGALILQNNNKLYSTSNSNNSNNNISFKQAFNNARNSGLKEFTWGGKRFNTKNKGEENYIFSNGKWINPNIKFTVSSITEPTLEEMKELDRKAKPIINFTVPAPTDMTSEEIDKLNSKAKPIWEGATFAKKGGNLVPKFLTPWGTLMLNELDKRQQALLDFSNKGINLAKLVTKPIEEQTKKAYNRNNKIASLLLLLWNSGAFNGVIDKRTGKQVTYKRAVDGIDGSMTRQAMENNKKRREAIPLSPRNQQVNNELKKGGLAAMREMTHAARTGGMNITPKLEGRSENFERLMGNVIKNPVSATIDATLYAADRAGIPSNATNYLRDLNVSIPYRMASASNAAVKTVFNGKSFEENYKKQLLNPNILQTFGMINPLINRNNNFSDEEMQVIKNMAGKKSYITNADIKRESEDGRYGAFEGNIGSYFTPTKVVQTAIGRTSGHNGILTDYFDVNTSSEEAQKDNKKYLDKANNGQSGWNYGTVRATMPYINSIDIMPDKYKIKTVLNLKK